MKKLVVLISGSRNWDDIAAIRREMRKLPKDAVIVHGAALGADLIAWAIGLLMGMDVRPYPADWDRFGNAAGAIRNVEMFDRERPNLFLGFHPDLKQSRGTRHAYGIAKKRGVKAEVFKE